MTPSEEQYFLDLATKVIAGRATRMQAQEFDALLNQSSEHRDRFEVFKADVVVAKDILQLVDASEATGPGLTETQLSRLKGEVEVLSKKSRHRWATYCFGIFVLMSLLVGAVLVAKHYNPPPKQVSGQNDMFVSKADILTPDEIIVMTLNELKSQF